MFKKSSETSAIETAINNVLQSLAETDPNSPEFTRMTDTVTKLTALRTTKKSVSPDTLAIVLGNLAGIIMILSYEQTRVIATKALGFVMKLK